MANVLRKEMVIAFRPELNVLIGSTSATVLLSQIVYWFSNNRLRVKRGGRMWLAKKRKDLAAECGLSLEQYKRAIRRLKNLGLVVVEQHMFAGIPVSFLWLDQEALASMIEIAPAARSDMHHMGGARVHRPTGAIPGHTYTENTNRDYDREQHERAAHAREREGRNSEEERVRSRKEQELEKQGPRTSQGFEGVMGSEKENGLRYIPDWVAERPGWGEKRLGIEFTAEEWAAKFHEVYARYGTEQ